MVAGIFFASGVAFAQTIKVFPDVSSTDWFFNDVNNMVEWDVIRGNDDGTFRPSNSVNRAELSAMWNRYDLRVQKLVGSGGNQAMLEYIDILETRLKKLEDQVYLAETPSTKREEALMNANIKFVKDMSTMTYDASSKYTTDIFNILLGYIDKIDTTYSYTPISSTPISSSTDCGEIKASYSASGFGQSTVLTNALLAAGCPIN